jgi:hypothetical protein
VRLTKPAVTMLLAASFVHPALAHHSFGMFDLQKNITYEGTVLQYNWENPHSHIILKIGPEARDPSMVGVWDIEVQAVNIMFRQGWTRSTYKRGDKATIVAHPMRDGSKGASLFYAIMPDGHRLYGDIARPDADPQSTGAPASK